MNPFVISFFAQVMNLSSLTLSISPGSNYTLIKKRENYGFFLVDEGVALLGYAYW